jgi:hypothetical protein
MSCWSDSAWAASPSAVLASSSAAVAFRWVTSSTWLKARLIWGYAGRLLAGSRGDPLDQLGGLPYRGDERGQGLACPLGHVHAGDGQLANLARRRLASLGQLAHLAGHHGKSAPVLASARRPVGTGSTIESELHLWICDAARMASSCAKKQAIAVGGE